MIQQGDKVFYSDNRKGKGILTYSNVATRIIQDLGLIPLMYEGIGLGARNSSIDKSIRDDFYQSKVVVLLLGEGEEWRNIADHWAIPELNHVVSIDIVCLIYVTPEITEEEIKNLGLPLSIDVVVIEDENHFATTLTQKLKHLMIGS